MIGNTHNIQAFGRRNKEGALINSENIKKKQDHKELLQGIGVDTDYIESQLKMKENGYPKIAIHQWQAMYCNLRYKRWVDVLYMGTGKTLVVLMTYIALRKAKVIHDRPMLLLIPTSKGVDSIVADVKKWTDFKVSKLGTKAEFDEDADIIVGTYRAYLLTTTKNKKLNMVNIHRIRDHFGYYCLDELHTLSNETAITTKALEETVCPHNNQENIWVTGLTGTTIGKHVHYAWSQFYIIDGGITFGRYKSDFVNTFCIQKHSTVRVSRTVRNQTGEIDTVEFANNPNMMEAFWEVIRSGAIVYHLQEVAKELPKPLFSANYYELSDELKKTIKDSMRESERLVGTFKEVLKTSYQVEMAHLSGFQYVNINETLDDEKSNNIAVPTGNLDKFNAMLHDIESKFYAEKNDNLIIIFYHYRGSGQILSQELTERGYDVIHFKPGATSKQNEKTTHRFDTTPLSGRKRPIALANFNSSGQSTNMQRANIAFMYDIPSEAKMLKQTISRIIRTGSKHKEVYLRFYAGLNTREIRVLSALTKGVRASDVVFNPKQQYARRNRSEKVDLSAFSAMLFNDAEDNELEGVEIKVNDLSKLPTLAERIAALKKKNEAGMIL